MIRFMFLLLFVVGCASDPALDYIETTAEKLQPAFNGVKIICPIAVAGAEYIGEDKNKIRQVCQTIAQSFKAVQAMQEVGVIAAGGEPCLDGCDQ